MASKFKSVTITYRNTPLQINETTTREVPVYGRDYTDKRYRELEMRLRVIYQQAADELRAKQFDFLEKHEKRYEKYSQQVQAGLLSEHDFRAWLRGQVYQSEQWAYKRGQLARMMADVDQQALALANEGRLDVFAENANWTAYKVEMETGMIATFGLLNTDAVVRLIADNPNMLPPRKLDDEKSYKWYNEIIQNAVIQGILQGETLDEIAKRVSEDTGEKALNALRRNARTAYTGAMNAGSKMAMERARDEFGVNLQKRWMATLDDKTRHAHAALDGQVQDVDEPFESELGPIMYPGDLDAEPANVWNCRCYMDEFYPEYDNARFRYDAEGNYVGDVSYEEWMESKTEEDTEPQFEIKHADYTPATTIAEAEKYANQFMGYNGHVSYRGLSVDAANACNKTIADIRENIPDFKLSGIEPMNMRANIWKGKTADAAYRWGGDGKLYINPNYYKNAKTYEAHVKEIDGLMKKILDSGKDLIDSGRVTGAKADYIEALINTKRQAVSQSYDFMQGTFVHEMGHALEDKYIRRELGEMYPGFDGVKDYLAQSRATYGGNISGYAIADGHEYIAESFTAWWYGENDKVDPVLSGLFEKVMSR